ncbi:MAG: CRISPR-associated endonuclease Cas1 [Cyanobium sp.]
MAIATGPARQAELAQERRLALARALVSGKIANGRVVLQRFTRRSGRPAVESGLRRLGQLQTLTGRAPCLNHLRGLEGSAAALYFRGLGGLLEDDGIGLAVRSRRPIQSAPATRKSAEQHLAQ